MNTLTVTDALAQLAAAWPRTSFSIEVDVWSHLHADRRQAPAIEWSIYHAEDGIAYRHPTLHGAVAAALAATGAGRGDLRLVDAAVSGL